ncbi:hypothetical protein NWF34_13705 [Gordonia sp. GONU]|uniref:SnoaL-like domain-containing protein n=1 Tax=Gordonia amicalis TaxID=89053 RepID=A0AAE4R355_9ACTN|nr:MULTISPECIES: hypothetical protein [Gordonia]ATD70356.1 hypothetical protein CNO18_08795 [Gordonia sp. 1D]MCR8898000.1 hypothetical protein [Gordonia sp. GONU]MCZ4578004.1 hypothetical protein [Gordonia amicalis]MDV6310813.1 hypothetical protein [Gordonia amicalis]
MNQIDPEIDDYLTRYAATLSAFDSTAAAQLWAIPGMIIDDRFAGVVDDRETMAHSLEQSYPLYRELGLASVSHECLNVEHLTTAISLVKVRWIFYGANGDQLTDSNAYYIVRRDDDGLHACVCIQLDDAEKLRALAAEHDIDIAEYTRE